VVPSTKGELIMEWTVDIADSNVPGERRIDLYERGKLDGNLFASELPNAEHQLRRRMRIKQTVGMLIIQDEIESLVEQLHRKWS